MSKTLIKYITVLGCSDKTLFDFLQPYRRFGGIVKVELDLPNYATKANLRRATDTDISTLE